MTEHRWVAIQHVPFEGPGLIAETAARRALRLEVCRVFEAAPLPEAGELAGLVVMGGPMGVSDTDEHPHLQAETELIASAVGQGTPVLGVCLGAQLLAHALGGRVYPGSTAQIGAGEVMLTAEGRGDPVLGCTRGERIPVVHWHAETFDLPAGAVRLARSETCENQAFRIGECAYGFQFHVEVDRELATGWQPHLPAGVRIDEHARAQIEAAGRSILAAFFDLAAARKGPRG
ncbi:MAG TPA: type 1 glutamine amidotransferase [Solirubrobacteraceae bacterium]